MVVDKVVDSVVNRGVNVRAKSARTMPPTVVAVGAL